MRAIVGAAFLVLGALGCGASAMGPVMSEEPAPVLTIARSSARLPTERHPEVTIPAKRCVITHEDLASTKQRWRLMLEDQKTTWASLVPHRGGEATVELSGSAQPTLPVTYVGEGLEVRSRAPTRDVKLFTTEPVWFGGVAMPYADHAFDVVGSQQDQVQLALSLGEAFHPSRLTHTVRCEVLAMEVTRSTGDDLPKLVGRRAWEVVGTAPVPLYREAIGGRVIVEWHAPAGTQLVGGKDEHGRRRVFIGHDDALIAAWIPVARMKESAAFLGSERTGGSGHAGWGRRGFGASRRVDYVCPTATPLFVVVGERVERVGAMPANQPFWMNLREKAETGHQRIRVDDTPLQLRGRARLAVEVEALRGCSTR